MDIIKVFGENVKTYRTNLKLSQEELAEKSGLHRTYISSIERFQRNVSLENIQCLGDALEIEPYKLLIPQKKMIPKMDTWLMNYAKKTKD